VLELAELIRELTGSTSSFAYTAPAVGDDPQMRCPDIRKARALLDWSPRVSLREGLLDTIEYFRRVLVAVPPRVAVRVRSNGRVGALARLWSLTAGRLWS
jgi:hypothetical protein